MFVVGPFAHIGADFRQDRLGDGGADSVDGDQVHARNAAEMGTGVASWGILAVGMWLAARWGGAREPQRLRGWCETRFHDGKGVFDRGVAFAELGGVEIKQRQGLLQDQEMLLTPGAGQGSSELVAILLAAGISQGSEGARITLARDHGAHDPWPRGARHIAEGWRSLNVHLQEGLVQMEDVGSTMLQKLGTMASEGTQGHEVRVGTQRGF